MRYFVNIDYKTGEILITVDKESAAYFYQEDESSLSTVDLIVGLLNNQSNFIWRCVQDEDDEDERYIIVS